MFKKMESNEVGYCGESNVFFGHNGRNLIDICLNRTNNCYQEISSINNIESIDKTTPYYMPYIKDFMKNAFVIFVSNGSCYFPLDVKMLKVLIKSITNEIDFWFDFNTIYEDGKGNSCYQTVSLSRFMKEDPDVINLKMNYYIASRHKDGDNVVEDMSDLYEVQTDPIMLNNDVIKYFQGILKIVNLNNR